MKYGRAASLTHVPSLAGKELEAMRDIKNAIQRRASEIAWEVYKEDYEVLVAATKEAVYSRAIDEVREEVISVGLAELAKRKEL